MKENKEREERKLDFIPVASRDIRLFGQVYALEGIQLLPMDKQLEFENAEQARHFLDAVLPWRDGTYKYHKSGLDLKGKPRLVLFQYDNGIIGCGVVVNRHKIEDLTQGMSLDEAQEQEITEEDSPRTIFESKGVLQFDPRTIRTVKKIEPETFFAVVDESTGSNKHDFSQAKTIYDDVTLFPSILELLEENRKEIESDF